MQSFGINGNQSTPEALVSNFSTCVYHKKKNLNKQWKHKVLLWFKKKKKKVSYTQRLFSRNAQKQPGNQNRYLFSKLMLSLFYSHAFLSFCKKIIQGNPHGHFWDESPISGEFASAKRSCKVFLLGELQKPPGCGLGSSSGWPCWSKVGAEGPQRSLPITISLGFWELSLGTAWQVPYQMELGHFLIFSHLRRAVLGFKPSLRYVKSDRVSCCYQKMDLSGHTCSEHTKKRIWFRFWNPC